MYRTERQREVSESAKATVENHRCCCSREREKKAPVSHLNRTATPQKRQNKRLQQRTLRKRDTQHIVVMALDVKQGGKATTVSVIRFELEMKKRRKTGVEVEVLFCRVINLRVILTQKRPCCGLTIF